MKRVAIPELLDTDSGTPEEVAASLRDLLNINCRFGGISSNADMLDRVATKLNTSQLSVLEIAAGSGEVSRLVVSRLAKKGIQIKVTLADRVRSHLGNHFPRLMADAVALPFCDGSFDVVMSNLFVHHLSRPQLFQFAQEGVRVARTAFLINDLIRSPWHLALVYAGLPLFRSRLTRHDAPASVRQAYAPTEMREILGKVSNSSLTINRYYLFRMSVELWKLHA
jgi:2-polyprenyl-3-methyl-5-hydroxy-6-metoxy-1,4-benzoquinol methylase